MKLRLPKLLQLSARTWPRVGQRTGNQGAVYSGFPFDGMVGFGPPYPGTYAVYREMSLHPTLALARAIVNGPILASNWTFQSRADTPPEWVQFITDQIGPMRSHILSECLRALEFGWRGFEKVYRIRGGQLVLTKLKPLLPELTQILVDDQTGQFAGMQQEGVELTPDKCFLYTYERDGDNFYGRSRHENVRQTWRQWKAVADKAFQYSTKIAGIVPIVHYPQGTSLDAAGNPISNFTNAQTILGALGSGKGVAIPNLFAGSDDPAAAAELAGKSAYLISFLEPASGGGYQSGFIDERRYLDSLLFRGWLRPERSALEGQSGTRADAEAHGDAGLADGDLLHQDIARHVNWYILDDLLAYNFGADARGSVYISPAPLQDANAMVFKQLLASLLSNPAAGSTVADTIDLPALLDLLGVPRKQ